MSGMLSLCTVRCNKKRKLKVKFIIEMNYVEILFDSDFFLITPYKYLNHRQSVCY